MALVLCTGIDFALTETRKLILENAGHTVKTAMENKEIVAACRENAFDVAVIGQIEACNIKCKVFELIRHNCSSARILELFTVAEGRVLSEADSWLEVPASPPSALTDKVFELANKKEQKLPGRVRSTGGAKRQDL